jgi:hypothetical protein
MHNRSAHFPGIPSRCQIHAGSAGVKGGGKRGQQGLRHAAASVSTALAVIDAIVRKSPAFGNRYTLFIAAFSQFRPDGPNASVSTREVTGATGRPIRQCFRDRDELGDNRVHHGFRTDERPAVRAVQMTVPVMTAAAVWGGEVDG